MIDIDNWMRELEEEEDIEIKNNEEYQTKLFEEYVLRGSDHQEERRKLMHERISQLTGYIATHYVFFFLR